MKIQFNFKNSDVVYYEVLKAVNREYPNMPYGQRMEVFASTLTAVHTLLKSSNGVALSVDVDSNEVQLVQVA